MFGKFAAKRISMSATKVESQPLAQRIAFFFRCYLLFPLCLIAIMSTWYYFRYHQLFPVKQVAVIDSAAHVDINTVKAIVLSDVESGFFRLSVNKLQAQLAGLPWVASVAVERQWPDKIIIQFSEYKPVAKWNNSMLVTMDGTLFVPGISHQAPSDLPSLEGPSSDVVDIVARYQQMNKILLTLHRHISRVVVSDRLAWTLFLDNKLQVNLGQKQPVERLEAFVAAYPQVFSPTGEQADYVDMRYDHGMAVHWLSSNK